MRHHILAIYGAGRHPRENIVIKQSNAAQKSNNQNPTNTTFPSHSFSESKQSKSRENPGEKKTLPKHQCIASAPTEPGRSRLRALSTRAGMCRPAALTWLLHTSQVRTGDSGHRRRPFSARSPCAWRRRFNVAMHELHFFRPSSRAGGCWSLAAWPQGVAGGSQRVS